jgi:hypothetical protein
VRALDVLVTGGTYNNGIATFTNNSGGTSTGFKTSDLVVNWPYQMVQLYLQKQYWWNFNVTGFKTFDLVVTGGTYQQYNCIYITSVSHAQKRNYMTSTVTV